MNLQTLLNGATGTGAGTALDTVGVSPFIVERNAVAAICVSSDWNGTVKLQSSVDGGSNWTDLVERAGASSRDSLHAVTLPPLIRANVTAHTAGSVSVYLLGSN